MCQPLIDRIKLPYFSFSIHCNSQGVFYFSGLSFIIFSPIEVPVLSSIKLGIKEFLLKGSHASMKKSAHNYAKLAFQFLLSYIQKSDKGDSYRPTLRIFISYYFLESFLKGPCYFLRQSALFDLSAKT